MVYIGYGSLDSIQRPTMRDPGIIVVLLVPLLNVFVPLKAVV